MSDIIKNLSDEQKIEVFQNLLQEVHDKTIIGYLIKIVGEHNGTCHESIIFNK